MIVYIPAPAAEAMSAALWALSRPAWVRGVNDTRYLFGWITDIQGGRWMVVDTEYVIRVHTAAVLGEIADILQPYVVAGKLMNEELTALGEFVESHRGRQIQVWAAFPPFFRDASLTYEQMINAGLMGQSSL